MKRFALAVSLLAVALWSGEASAADIEPDRLIVIAERTTVHELPSANQPKVMRIKRGQALLGFQRLGPGLYDDWGPFAPKRVIEIPAGEVWVDVGVVRSGGKSGWVRAADVAPDYRAEIEAKVINPCARAAVRLHGPLTKHQEDVAVQMVKQQQAAELAALSREIAAAVAGKPGAERRQIYKRSFTACIAG